MNPSCHFIDILPQYADEVVAKPFFKSLLPLAGEVAAELPKGDARLISQPVCERYKKSLTVSTKQAYECRISFKRKNRGILLQIFLLV